MGMGEELVINRITHTIPARFLPVKKRAVLGQFLLQLALKIVQDGSLLILSDPPSNTAGGRTRPQTVRMQQQVRLCTW